MYITRFWNNLHHFLFVFQFFDYHVVIVDYYIYIILIHAICNSKKNNASIYVVEEKFEDAKNVIRSRNSKMERKYNGQKKKGKMKNNNLQNTTQKTIDRATRNTLITGD